MTRARGGFVARFLTSLGRCATYTIQAHGATGSRARLISKLALGCKPGG